MSNFVSRSLVLGLARLSNQGLALLSPVVLVRLLDIGEYGRYRQFAVTAALVVALAGFAVGPNLNYLIARSPREQSVHMSNACLLMLAAGVAGVLVVALGRGLLVPQEIAVDWPLLALYVLLALNLEVPMFYWLAHGRSDQVLLYTLGVTALRLTGVIGAACVFEDVSMMFMAMIGAELIRNAAVYLWLRRRGLLVFQWDRAAMREQLRLALPLGAGSVLHRLNEQIGKMLVGIRMGAAPLAIYSTAAYQAPVVGIVQSTLADVVFPHMVKRSVQDRLQGLRLWRRANVLTFAAICPAWLLLTYFAEPLIRLLFTEVYLPATPYFQALLLLMLRQCFQFSVPLRSIGDNASFARANGIALALNVALIFLLMPRYGLWGPTLGVLVSQFLVPVLLGQKVLHSYGVRLRELCDWPRLGLALVCSAAALATLHLTLGHWAQSWMALAAGLGLFAVVYLTGARLLLREEYEYFLRSFGRRAKVA